MNVQIVEIFFLRTINILRYFYSNNLIFTMSNKVEMDTTNSEGGLMEEGIGIEIQTWRNLKEMKRLKHKSQL